MDKKLIGIVTAIIAMVSGVVFLIWGMTRNLSAAIPQTDPTNSSDVIF